MFKVAGPIQRIEITRLRHAIVIERPTMASLRYSLPIASFVALAGFAMSSSDMLLLA